MALTKWVPTTNLMELRRLGKLGEELGELGNVASRCIIQGIDEVDPGTGKVNRQRLLDELADVAAQIDCTIAAFGLDDAYFDNRRLLKRAQMAEWEAMFAPDGVSPSRKINSLAEFCAEGERLGLTAADLAGALKDRPEFADCLPTAAPDASKGGKP